MHAFLAKPRRRVNADFAVFSRDDGFVAVHYCQFIRELALPLQIMGGFASAARRGDQPRATAPEEREAVEDRASERQQRVGCAAAELRVLEVLLGRVLLVGAQHEFQLGFVEADTRQRRFGRLERLESREVVCVSETYRQRDTG